MKAIVNVDPNWGIGLNGKLLERIPEDMKFFKKTTLGKIVIMGRETFESMPGKAPLTGRINIVLSTRTDFNDDRVIICRSLQELFQHIKNYPCEDVFVIGGGAVYAELMPYCTEAYVTKNDRIHAADKYFPDLDRLDGWEMVSKSDVMSFNDINFYFTEYKNKKPVMY